MKLMQLMMTEFHLIASVQHPDTVHAGSVSHCLGQLDRTKPSLMISATAVQSNSMTVYAMRLKKNSTEICTFAVSLHLVLPSTLSELSPQ